MTNPFAGAGDFGLDGDVAVEYSTGLIEGGDLNIAMDDMGALMSTGGEGEDAGYTVTMTMEGSSSDGGSWSQEWSEGGEGDFADFDIEGMAADMGADLGVDDGVMGGLMDDLQAGVMNAQMAGDASHQMVITDVAMATPDLNVAADPMAAMTAMGNVMTDAGIGMTDIAADHSMTGLMDDSPVVAQPQVDPFMMMPGANNNLPSVEVNPMTAMMNLGTNNLDANDPMAIATQMSAMMN